MKKLIYCILIFYISIDLSCSSNDSFLIKNLTNYEKSRIITQKGIKKYNYYLLKKKDINSIKKVRKYFLIALNYYQNNKSAVKYIKKVNSFKRKYIVNNIKNALKYKNKKKRTMQDDFNMCFFLQKALETDPKNIQAKKIKKEIKPVYKKLIKYYLTSGEKLKKQIIKTKSITLKRKYIFQALDNFGRAYLIDKNNSKAKNEKKFFEDLVVKEIEKLLTVSYNLINRDKYAYAYNNIKILYAFSSKCDNKYLKNINKLKYLTYVKWADYYYKKKKYEIAKLKINIALKINSSKYSIDLKNKIQKAIIASNVEQSFDTILETVDELIDNDNLIEANNKIKKYIKNLKDKKKKKEFFNRLKLIKNKISKIYLKAIKNYNEENYTDAIKDFKIIFAINKNYKDTKQYLKKAEKKLQILEEF